MSQKWCTWKYCIQNIIENTLFDSEKTSHCSANVLLFWCIGLSKHACVSLQTQYNLARAQASFKSLLQIHEKNGNVTSNFLKLNKIKLINYYRRLCMRASYLLYFCHLLRGN